MKTAAIPSGCDLNDATMLPWKNHEIECPNPHPGQKSSPEALRGQRLM